jgi:hypothetical protein
MITDASAKGMELSSRSACCETVRLDDLRLPELSPLLTAVLPANTTLSTSTCLFHNTCHTLIA